MDYVIKKGECCEIIKKNLLTQIITIGGSLTAKVNEAHGTCPFCGETIDVKWEECGERDDSSTEYTAESHKRED